MIYSVQIKVMPLKELLDPQGKTVLGGLQNLGLSAVEDVRIGKNITLQINAASEAEARQIAEEAGKKLLANPVMEYFEISETPNPRLHDARTNDSSGRAVGQAKGEF